MMSAFSRFALCILIFGISCTALAQDDVADVPSQHISISKKQEYFLIGKPETAKDAKPQSLLLILPGGDGSADFNPFVRRIFKNALPEHFLVAELIAVPSKNPNQVVWPTTNQADPKQNFPTESFINAVVSDVSKRATLDPQHIMALGWSSSGPALYVDAATKDAPVKGFFIAMSVFHPNDLPEPNVMKERKFYLLHSPDDQTCPIWMARQAKAKLESLGAPVTLAEYPGGHGWMGDVFGNIRAGIDWLCKAE